MGTKRKREGILEKTAEVFDLPGDLVAGLPRVELVGNRELRMENHRGILAYGTEEIHISGGKLILKIRGEDLELRSMNAGELLITGLIRGVDVE
ncbi:YabP/YqfC family sporulation protein [Pseudoflavonifractor sp. HCP28S3_F10]|uniref:YabP/YqfC family sporulation protein n=1 Tax=Pseudoflavonifractor sp. HCP28S3_F10 TaxID=3438947 RepID=UPI002A87E912|nr:YabP/YqfC family sporulation protein [Clostridiales bacterium]MDY4182566.1 YabP/YqfC family sporulation protein [Pseudoflavonifractor sp.]